MEHLAQRLSRRIEYRRALWSQIAQELTSGNLDLVCSAATVTEARKKDVSFAEPHLYLKLALVERQVTRDLTDSRKARFGVRRGTTAEEFLHTILGHEPEMLSESNEEIYHALSAGDLDAVIDDSPIARHFAAAVPGLRYAKTYEGTDAAYAIMLAKDNDPLRLKLNAILLMLEAEGTLASLRERWFGKSALLIA